MIAPLRAALAASLLALGSGQAGMVRAQPAQTVLVLSGEHADFSRLALVLPATGGWRVRPVEGGYLLQIDQAGVILDPSRIFDLIPRTRIETAILRRDGLFLGVRCDCHLRSFEDRPGVLVIDIVTGPDPATPAPRPEGDRAVEPLPAPRAGGVPALGAARSWLGSAMETPANGALVPAQAPPGSEVLSDESAAAMRSALIEQIGRAASQELVQLAPPGTQRAQTAPSRDAGSFVANHGSASSEGPAPTGPGIAIGTVFDRDNPSRPPVRMTARGKTCVADTQLDIAAWASADDPWGSLTAARAELVGEFDAPDPQAVLGLARTYIALGFGAEARATLEAFGSVDLAEDALLRTLAEVIDDAPSDSAPLAGMWDCDTSAALWALLAAPASTTLEDVAIPAVLRGFSALPAHLRDMLGGRLAERLVAAGHDGAARSIAAAIARAPTQATGTLDLLEARLELPRNADAAIARLTGLAASNAPESAEALVLLVEAYVQGGAPVPPDVIGTLAARAFELRGSALGDRLEMAQALAHGSAGEFDAAFRIARRISDARSASAEAMDGALHLPLLSMLAASADDAAFLTHALATPAWRRTTAPPPVRIAMAERFLALGLPETALEALPARPRASAEEVLLRARALLDSGAADAALPLLATLPESTADAPRAEALAALGDTAAAVATLRRIEAQGRAAEIAWRAGDDGLIREHGTDLQRGLVARDAQAPATDVPLATVAPLAQGRALIAESEALRASIDMLLAAMPAP
jgi:hypothetical protein